jgi:hypothetical protein
VLMTDRSTTDLLLSDIAAIRTAAALKEWASRWADVIHSLPSEMQAELRTAYKERMETNGPTTNTTL